MITLRTLGGLDLRGSDDHELRQILAQPKRLALLAFLAVAHPHGFHRRDMLVALFWPDLDHGHARAALRKAVFVLREALGETVVVNRGDEELDLDRAQLWCDAVAFEQALGEGRRTDALELYQGDLLPGFFISEAPEFERWVERERVRLRERAAAAAWALADDAESRRRDVAALQWARRATSLSPDDEHALRRLIGLLDRVGDRAGALHAYEEFARQLAKDYEAEPSVETNALIQAVRLRVRRISGERAARRSTPAGPSRARAVSVVPHPRRWITPQRGAALAVALLGASALTWAALRPVLQPSPTVAVGSIRNFTADTSTLTGALPRLLATGLAQQPRLRVIGGTRIAEELARLKPLSPDPGDPEAAIALAARHAGARELIEGELYRVSEHGLRLDLRRINLRTGAVLASYTVESENAFVLVQRATAQLAAAWGGRG